MSNTTQTPPVSPTPSVSPDNQQPGIVGPVSAKAGTATVAVAVATVFWTLMSAFVFKEGSLTDTQMTALTGGTATILAACAAFFVNEWRSYINYWHKRHPGLH